MEVGDTGFGLGAKLEFFFRPNFGTIMVVTNQDKPSYTCINAHTHINMNILIIDYVIIYKYIEYIKLTTFTYVHSQDNFLGKLIIF